MWKKGLFFLGKGILEGRRKTKRKAPDTLGRCCYFFVVYDVLYSISTGLIPERIQLRF